MSLNPEYVKRALCFHGQPLQKIWDEERGDDDFLKMGIQTNNQNYSIYQERQKFFTFRDRAKRLKLHQFLAKKAEALYSKDLHPKSRTLRPEFIEKARQNEHLVTLPPYEFFLKKKDPFKAREYILSNVKPGDLVYCLVVKDQGTHFILKPLCTGEPVVRYLADIDIKVIYTKTNRAVGNVKNPTTSSSLTNVENPLMKQIKVNDYLRCEVVNVSSDSGRLSVTFNQNSNEDRKLGPVEIKDLPKFFSMLTDSPKTYSEFLKESNEFLNPNYDDLFIMNGLDVNETFSLLTNIKCDFPRGDYARELGLTQANCWAMKSLAAGIDCIKNGQNLEAFQHLNKTLHIDPHNVEGFVARGALYANQGSFLKGVADFEKALSYNPCHPNARKYLVDTLIALAGTYEDEQKLEEAMKTYRKCLDLIPEHNEVLLKLNSLNIQMHNNINTVLPGFKTDLISSPLNEQVVQETLGPKNNEAVPEPQEKLPSSSSSDSASSTESESETKETKHDLQTKAESPSFNKPFFSLYNDFDLSQNSQETLEKLKKSKKNENKKKKSKKAKKMKKSLPPEENEEPKPQPESLSTTTNLYNHKNAIDFLKGPPSEPNEKKVNEDFHLEGKSSNTSEFSFDKVLTMLRSKNMEALESSESPPPPPRISEPEPRTNSIPNSNSNQKIELKTSTTNTMISFGLNRSGKNRPSYHYANAKPNQQNHQAFKPKLSFQIKKPINMDQFNVRAVAEPFKGRQVSSSPSENVPKHHHNRSMDKIRKEKYSRERSRSWSRSKYQRSLSKSRSRSRSRSPTRRRYSRSPPPPHRTKHKSRSNSRPRRRDYYSRSRSNSRFRNIHHRSRSQSRSRSPSRSRLHLRSVSKTRFRNRYSRYSRSKSRSPPLRRRSRSRTRSRSRSFSKIKSRRRSFRRSPSNSNRKSKFFRKSRSRSFDDDGPCTSSSLRKPKLGYGKFLPLPKPSTTKLWIHDQIDESQKKDDGILIEEIDEIIKKAQKVRKETIIKRDKNILKRPY